VRGSEIYLVIATTISPLTITTPSNAVVRYSRGFGRDEFGPFREGAFGVGMVHRFTPSAVGACDCLAYPIDTGVEGDSGK
jgi:hypothetical protein